MLERGDVTDLGDQADRGQRVDAAQAAQPRDRRRPRPLHRLLNDQPVEAIAAREQYLMVREVLAEDDLDELLLEANPAQPLQVTLRPRLAGAVKDDPTAQQQLADAMTSAHQIAAQILTRPDEIAQRLELEIGHDDRPKLPGRQQPRELQGITHIGLDAIARLARD